MHTEILYFNRNSQRSNILSSQESRPVLSYREPDESNLRPLIPFLSDLF